MDKLSTSSILTTQPFKGCLSGHTSKGMNNQPKGKLYVFLIYFFSLHDLLDWCKAEWPLCAPKTNWVTGLLKSGLYQSLIWGSQHWLLRMCSELKPSVSTEAIMCSVPVVIFEACWYSWIRWGNAADTHSCLKETHFTPIMRSFTF